MRQHPAPTGVPVSGTLELVPCPECGHAAEVESRGTVAGTGGAVDLVFVRCIWRHWFLMPAAGRGVDGGR